MPGPIIGRVRVLRIQLAGSTSLILAVLLASAVGPVESNAKPTGRAAAAIQSGIYVQGDSLTVDSGPYLKQFASPSTVTVDARIGRHAYQGVALIRKKLPGLPGAVVVALGTNDDYDSVGVSLFRTHVNSIMGMLGAKRCVIWTTLYQKPKPAKRGKPRPPMVFTELNAVIDQTAKAWPNVRRVPWAEMAAANPDWFKYDSVHPTDAGYVARAKATVAALKRCPPWAGWPDKDDGSGGATPGT
ncbi:MAG: GDSL-type esterase/lipase family protein [Actinomycetes bacterium]